MVQEYIKSSKEYISKYISKFRGDDDVYTRESQVKQTEKVRSNRRKSTSKKPNILMEKLEGKIGPALFLFILVGVFGGAAIGQQKCKTGFRNRLRNSFFVSKA